MQYISRWTLRKVEDIYSYRPMNGVGGSKRWIAIMAHRFLPEIYTLDAADYIDWIIIMCFAVGVYVSPHNYSTNNHFLVHRLKEI